MDATKSIAVTSASWPRHYRVIAVTAPWVIWALPLLVVLADLVHEGSVENHPPELWRAETLAAACVLWAALTPAMLALGSRFGLSRPSRAKAIGIHGIAVLVATLLKAGVSVVAFALLAPSQPTSSVAVRFAQSVRDSVAVTLLVYGATAFVGYAIALGIVARERAARAAASEAQLAQAELGALRAQLHPHFLFNALNAVAGLVREQDAAGALRALELLGDTLRHVLATTGVEEVPLRDEVEFVRRYLAIEQVRFPDRLRIDYAVGADTLDAMVPSMLLQPLVENALRHGIHRRSTTGRLEIGARRVNEQLEIVVRDDGPGLARAASGLRGHGVGLANTRARLTTLYGEQGRLDLADGTPTGAVATVLLPFRRATGGNGAALDTRGRRDP